MKLDSSRSLLLRLLVLVILVLVPPVALLTWHAVEGFERGLVPELDKKAATIARDVGSQLERAVGYGIPIERLVGVEAFFSPVLKANPAVRYLALTDSQGRVLFVAGVEASVLEPHFRSADYDVEADGHRARIGSYLDFGLPVMSKGARVGEIHVGMGEDWVEAQVRDIVTDIVVVLLVSLVGSFELLLFVVAFNVTGPVKMVGAVIDRARRGDFSAVVAIRSEDEVGRFGRMINAALRQADELYRSLEDYIAEVKAAHFDKSVVEKVGDIEARVRFLFRFAGVGGPQPVRERSTSDVRLALFLFVFAEELSRSFMPLYIRELYTPIAGMPMEMVLALPIAVFMACIAIASPWAGAVTERVGCRKVFLLGLVPATLGYVMSAAPHGLVDFILWRAATAFGYAVVTMACQGYISRVTSQDRRAQGLGTFVGAVLTASVCGTAMGGVLAERIGFHWTFALSAGLAVVSGLLVYRVMDVLPPGAERDGQAGPRDMVRLLRNWRFSVLMVFAAIPAKMALTGFLFFLAPLYLSEQAGADLGDIARTMAIYPVTVALLSPLVARLADHTGWRAGLVALGGVVGGAGLLVPMVLPGVPGVAAAIFLLGVSHGLSASPQLAMVPDVCWTECRAMGQTGIFALVRLIERVGSTVGPLLAALLVPLYGQAGAVVALGAVVLGMSAVFAVLAPAFGSGPNIRTEEEVA
jgi:predicted MFS family arabinose efflux permease